MTSESYQISDRVSAAIANNALKDAGLTTAQEASHAIDKNKLRRQRQNHKVFVSIHQQDKIIFLSFDGIYMNGRENATSTQWRSQDFFKGGGSKVF